MSNSFSLKNDEFCSSINSADFRPVHASNASDLMSMRNLRKEKKLKEISDYSLEKFTSIEHEWKKFNTTKNQVSKISFKQSKKLRINNSQNDDIIKLATSTVKLLGRKANNPPTSSKSSKKLSQLLNSVAKELNFNTPKKQSKL